MPAQTKTDTLESTLVGIDTAIKDWVEVKEREYSAIWTVIHACYKARKAGANEQQIRTRLKYTAMDSFPAYSKDSVNTTITGIMKITMGATEKHFKKWKRDGTGYHKAWGEFKKKREDKSYNSTIKQTSVRIGEDGQPIYTESTGEIPPDEPADESGTTKTTTKRKPSPGKKQLKEEEAEDPTFVWATKISRNTNHWPQLIVNLRKDNLLAYDMVAATVNAYVKGSERNAYEFISTILSHNKVLYTCTQQFLQDTPDFPDLGKTATESTKSNGAKQKRAKKINKKAA